MSVLACNRRGRENIMCRRLILQGKSYICEDCWEELQKAHDSWPNRMTRLEVREAIEQFMDTKPGAVEVLDEAGIEEEFSCLTQRGAQ